MTSRAKRQLPFTLNDLPDKSSLNGTIAELTDIADLPPIDFRGPAAEAPRPYRQPLLARERLRYGLPGAVTRLPARPQQLKALLCAAARRGRLAAVKG